MNATLVCASRRGSSGFSLAWPLGACAVGCERCTVVHTRARCAQASVVQRGTLTNRPTRRARQCARQCRRSGRRWRSCCDCRRQRPERAAQMHTLWLTLRHSFRSLAATARARRHGGRLKSPMSAAWRGGAVRQRSERPTHRNKLVGHANVLGVHGQVFGRRHYHEFDGTAVADRRVGPSAHRAHQFDGGNSAHACVSTLRCAVFSEPNLRRRGTPRRSAASGTCHAAQRRARHWPHPLLATSTLVIGRSPS